MGILTAKNINNISKKESQDKIDLYTFVETILDGTFTPDIIALEQAQKDADIERAKTSVKTTELDNVKEELKTVIEEKKILTTELDEVRTTLDVVNTEKTNLQTELDAIKNLNI